MDKEGWYDIESSIYPCIKFKYWNNYLLIINGITVSCNFPSEKIMLDYQNIEIETLRDYIPIEKNGGFIPFSRAERERLYPRAFSELERYMQDADKHFISR